MYNAVRDVFAGPSLQLKESIEAAAAVHVPAVTYTGIPAAAEAAAAPAEEKIEFESLNL